MDEDGRRNASDDVADLAWPEVEARLAAGAVAVLPIGAWSKEHGRHLPLATDGLQAAYYAGAVAAAVDALVWPVVGYGYYPVFTEYPGSVSLSRETFEATVAEILDGIAAAGARRIAVLNTGISTIAPLEGVLATRPARPPIALVNCYAGPRFADAVAAVERQPFGGHADEIETSLMLAIDPGRVRLEHAEPQPTRIVRGRFNRTRSDAPNYSPSGVNGDPTLASAEKGALLLEALIDDVVTAVRRLAGA